MAFTVNIAKSGSEADVKVGSFSEPRIAWFELVNLLEKGQDDTIGEEATDVVEFAAYQEALDAAFDTKWDTAGSVTVDLDGGISFAVVEIL
jgi:hypothetical protein